MGLGHYLKIELVHFQAIVSNYLFQEDRILSCDELGIFFVEFNLEFLKLLISSRTLPTI
jgi:hypothetical protein